MAHGNYENSIKLLSIWLVGGHVFSCHAEEIKIPVCKRVSAIAVAAAPPPLPAATAYVCGFNFSYFYLWITIMIDIE